MSRTKNLAIIASVALIAAACSSGTASSPSASAPAAASAPPASPAATVSSPPTSATSAPASAAPAASSAYSASNPLKVGFILDGSITDGGFNTAIYNGIQQANQTFGSSLQATYKQSVPESPQSTQVIDSLVQAGDQLIVATSFGYHTYIAQAAKQYPNVDFLQYESTEMASNLGEFYFGIDQAWYLAGMAAGAASKNGQLGMVGSFPIPSLLIQVNAFELGAQLVNPKATTRIVWLNSWFDPAKATQAADGLVTDGVDVLANTMDDGSVVQVAQSKGIPVVGHDVDQQKYAPTQWLTGAEFVFGPYFVQQIRAIMNGSWSSQNYFGLLKDGVTALAAFGPAYQKDVPASVQTQVSQKKAALLAGTFDDFTGPIYNQGGKLVVPSGTTLTATQKEGMNYLVKGVIGTIGS